ncbi:MAG: hypothetical protein ACJ72N_01135 [Labedaea sp.]
MDEFIQAALRAYGDLRNPDYSFQSEALQRQPWRELMVKLCERFTLENWADLDDDVSLSYVIKSNNNNNEAWNTWPSFVAPLVS